MCAAPSYSSPYSSFSPSKFGLEAILGAFLAGATLKLVDRDEGMTHALFRQKLEAVGFGVFVPFFFVSTGIKLDVSHLFHSGSALVRVPLFLAALLLVWPREGTSVDCGQRPGRAGTSRSVNPRVRTRVIRAGHVMTRGLDRLRRQ